MLYIFKYYNLIYYMENLLNNLELKYGGLVQNVSRTCISKYENNYYNKHQGGDRMNSIYHQYSKYYSKYLEHYIHKDNIILAEVGILTGIGLAIWCDIFPKANIYGFDIDINNFNNNFKNLIDKGAFIQNKPNINIFDQYLNNSKYILDTCKDKISIVIDDGCHLDKAIINTFESFLPHLSNNFVYFIEDNINVHRYLKIHFPQYNIFYENEMTIITNK